MRGDKLIVKEEHIRAARQLMPLLFPKAAQTPDRLIISIGGESGSGKSEIAAALSQSLAEEGITSVILQQDDYFKYPPQTNASMRKRDINHVGPSEVRLDLLDRNLGDIIKGKVDIKKPLVIFDEDRITEETVRVGGLGVIIVEGTYTTILQNVHRHVFIDRTYLDTRKTRQCRAREKQDEFLERVLQIEHDIISSHKAKADIIVTKDYGVAENA
jgi:uridine kinase